MMYYSTVNPLMALLLQIPVQTSTLTVRSIPITNRMKRNTIRPFPLKNMYWNTRPNKSSYTSLSSRVLDTLPLLSMYFWLNWLRKAWGSFLRASAFLSNSDPLIWYFSVILRGVIRLALSERFEAWRFLSGVTISAKSWATSCKAC